MIRLDEHTTVTFRKMCINCDDRERERRTWIRLSLSLSLSTFFLLVGGRGRRDLKNNHYFPRSESELGVNVHRPGKLC